MNFANIYAHINNLATEDKDLQSVLQKLDYTLQSNEALRTKQDVLQCEVDGLQFDVYFMRRMVDAQRKIIVERQSELQLAEKCYVSTLELVDIVRYLDISKIAMCDVLQKQMESERDWRVKEEYYKRRHEQRSAMENRHVVREFRVTQAEHMQLQKSLEHAQLQFKEKKHHWQQKLLQSTRERNLKILNLVINSQKLAAMREHLPSSLGFDDAKQKLQTPLYHMRLLTIENFPKVANFFSSFSSKPITTTTEIQTCKNDVIVRSILVSSNASTDNNVETGIKKRVHFNFNEDSLNIETNKSKAQQCYVNTAKNTAYGKVQENKLIQNPQHILVSNVSNEISSSTTSTSDSDDGSVKINVNVDSVEDVSKNNDIPEKLDTTTVNIANQRDEPAQITHIISSEGVDSNFKIPAMLPQQLNPTHMNFGEGLLDFESSTTSEQSNLTAKTLNYFGNMLSNPGHIRKPQDTTLPSNIDAGDQMSSPGSMNFQVVTASDDFFFEMNSDGDQSGKNSYEL